MARLKDRDRNRGHRIEDHGSSPVNLDTLPPIFSLEHMQRGYCVDDCDASQKALFADALWKRSQLTWAQLRTDNRHGLGCEKINGLKVPIPPKVKEDVDILSFRCIGTAPMVGYREGRIFHIIWLDLGYKVYRHSN